MPVNYIRHLYKEDITKLIQTPQDICDYDNSIDFIYEDTKLIIENILTKK